MGGVHDVHLGAEGGPEIRELADRVRILGPVVRLRSQDYPTALEQFGKARGRAGLLGARDGVSGDDVDRSRDSGAQGVAHADLDRADIGDGGPRLQCRRRCSGCRAHGQNRYGEDHQVGIRHRLGHVAGDQVGIAQSADLRPVRRAGFADGYRAHGAGRAGGSDHRGSDQAAADHRHLRIDQGRVPMKAARASTTARLCSSRPMVRRRWSGRP